MRIRTRFVTLGLAAAAALAVGAIGFVVSASGHNGSPPIPRGCPPSTGGDNKSCWDFWVRPSNPHGTFRPATLFGHTHTHYNVPGDASNGGKAKTVIVWFDRDFVVNLAAVPGACNSGGLANDTPKQAMAQCKNQYLGHPPTRFTGSAHAVATQAFPAGVRLCTLLFKRNNRQIILFSRAYLDNGGPSANCRAANPNNENSTGPTRANSILIGTIAPAGIPGGFGKKLTVPRIDTQALPLDEFSATVRKGNFLRAKCTNPPDTWRTRTRFIYSGTGQAVDTVTKARRCT